MKKIWAPFILGGFGLVILLSLCAWQVQRLAWKEGLIEELNARLSEPAVAIETLDAFQDAQAVQISGVIGEGFTDKLTGDNTLGAGYVRIVPLISGDRMLALELGFFAEGEQPSDVAGTHVNVDARIYLPEGAGAYDQSRNLWVGYDLVGMTEMFGAETALFVPETQVADGYFARPYRNSLPNNHLQYAITWALFAFVWLAMTGYWGYSRMRKDKV